MAQDYGNWKQGMDPDVLNAFPAQRFIRDRAVKEARDFHRLHENEVQLKTDLGFWKALNQDFGNPYGPWGWGCGHDVEDVDRAEAERRGLIQPGQQLQPVEKDFNDDLQASTRGLDPEMITELKNNFGDQIVVEGDSVRWRQEKPASKPREAPPPAPPEIESVPPLRLDPISKKVSAQVTRKSLTAVQHAIQQIDKVHDDGNLAPIPVTHRVAPRSQGTYYSGGRSIGLRQRGSLHPELTLAHEVGHWIDEMGLPGFGFSSPNHPDLADWRKAVESSQAFQNLTSKPGYTSQRRHRRYLLRWTELWARAYAQFISVRSGDKTMLDQLRAVQDGKTAYWIDSQWTEDDFKPIQTEIEKVFTKMKWL
jgi:hypothetical protein